MILLSRLCGAFLFSVFLSSLEAQIEETQKLRTANNDLRGEKVVFQVKSHQIEREGLVLLKRGGDQYILDFPHSSLGPEKKASLGPEKKDPAKHSSAQERSNESRRVKVSNEMAQKVDGQLVKKFIQFKYVMGRKNKKECKHVFTLSMRGEEQKVCQDETDKIKQLAAIVKGLKERLRIQ